VIICDRWLTRAPVDSVTVNNYQAARAAAQHLIGQGWHRVGLVAGPVQTTTGASRLAGYRAALRAAGRAPDPSLIGYADFRTEGGYAATRQLLRQRQPPDALLFSNNLMTVGGLQAIAEAGLAIPGDIAVVGFDDAAWATALRPPLTVWPSPRTRSGRRRRSCCCAASKGRSSRPGTWSCGQSSSPGQARCGHRSRPDARRPYARGPDARGPDAREVRRWLTWSWSGPTTPA
jgi:DNA-binding LacI/PurR family transcriptional regulator